MDIKISRDNFIEFKKLFDGYIFYKEKEDCVLIRPVIPEKNIKSTLNKLKLD